MKGAPTEGQGGVVGAEEEVGSVGGEGDVDGVGAQDAALQVAPGMEIGQRGKRGNLADEELDARFQLPAEPEGREVEQGGGPTARKVLLAWRRNGGAWADGRAGPADRIPRR